VAYQADQIQQAICGTIQADIAELRRFLDRRISELSAEIHATTELMDFSESTLLAQLSAIRQQIGAFIALPSSATRNSGMELEAVVEATESAANRILEAAEAIGDWARAGRTDIDAIKRLNRHIDTIFEACAFQDLTSQRIRRAIQHLQTIETMLSDILQVGEQGGSGQPVPSTILPTFALPDHAAANPDLAQGAIDSMFD